MKKVSDVFKKGEHNIGYVDSSFTTEFGNDEISEGSLLSYTTLKRSMSDSKIIEEFNIQECTLSDVLRTMQEDQPPMKDGYANIFYIKGHSRVVSVSWDDGEWIVDDWGRVDDGWFAGGRVFSPATVSVTPSTQTSETLTLQEAIKIVKAAGMKITKEVITIEEI